MSQIKHLISVIVPTYNSKQYVCDAIDSALAQTYKQVEVVVVDDGSSDGTGDFLEGKYGRRIKYIYKSNGGPASARNLGIKNSEGEFIAFLDADDFWFPEKLDHQIKVFSDGVVLVGCLENTKNDGSFQVVRFEELVVKNCFPNSGIMVRRSVLEEIGLFDERPEIFAVEDWDMWLRFSKMGRLLLLHKDLLTVRVTENSISAPAQAEKMLINEISVLKKNLHGRPLLYCRALSNRHFSAAWSLSTQRKDKRAFQCMFLGVALDPSSLFRQDKMALFLRVLCGLWGIRK